MILDLNPLVNPSIDAREMLVNARKLQKWKIWIKGFQTHQFRSVFDNSMIIYTTLKLGWFSKKWSFSVIITENVGKLTTYFQKNIARWFFTQNTWELVRLKALDVYFAILSFTSIYEHFTSIHEMFLIWPERQYIGF